MSEYKKLRAIDVSEHIEKKGKFNYLSWAWAVDVLLQNDEKATFEFKKPTVYDDGSMMVWCDVHAFGKTMTGYLPVTDYRNAPIQKPNSMEINTAMQRCLAKTIALHGIGLYIFAGEDIPEGNASEMLENKYKETGREGALALYNRMSDEERAECKAVIEKIRANSKKESSNGTAK